MVSIYFEKVAKTMHIQRIKSYSSNILDTRLYTLKNQRLKIAQLEKAHFIKVNELKLTEVEIF